MCRTTQVWISQITDNVTHGHLKEIVGGARRRAEKKGVPYSELFDHVRAIVAETNGHCQCCGVKFQAGKKSNKGEAGGAGTSLTLHRIVSGKGYVPGNVKVICKICNDDIGECSNVAILSKKIAALAWQEVLMTGAAE